MAKTAKPMLTPAKSQSKSTPARSQSKSTTSTRNAAGRFTAGNQGGPGRPRKSASLLSIDELRSLAEAAKHPYILAMTLRDSQGMEDVRRDFTPEIAVAIERIVQIGVLAERVLQRRLTAELQG